MKESRIFALLLIFANVVACSCVWGVDMMEKLYPCHEEIKALPNIKQAVKVFQNFQSNDVYRNWSKKCALLPAVAAPKGLIRNTLTDPKVWSKKVLRAVQKSEWGCRNLAGNVVDTDTAKFGSSDPAYSRTRFFHALRCQFAGISQSDAPQVFEGLFNALDPKDACAVFNNLAWEVHQLSDPNTVRKSDYLLMAYGSTGYYTAEDARRLHHEYDVAIRRCDERDLPRSAINENVSPKEGSTQKVDIPGKKQTGGTSGSTGL